MAQEQLLWDTIPSARAHKDSSIKPGFLDKVSRDENVLPAFKSEPRGPCANMGSGGQFDGVSLFPFSGFSEVVLITWYGD